MEVNGALLCLDSTEDVLEEAQKLGVNLVIAHHPIVFGGLKRFNGKNYVERTVIKAIKNDIAVYAIHTNLDNVIDGVNDKIAEKLGLKNTRILAPKRELLKKLVVFAPKKEAAVVREAMFTAGAGNIGNYSECSFNTEGKGTFKGNEQSDPAYGEKGKRQTEAEEKIEMILPGYAVSSVLRSVKQVHPYEEVAYDVYPLENSWQEVGSGMIGELEEPMKADDFLQHIKRSMEADCVRYTKAVKNEVKSIALCGGSGSFLLGSAIANGADVFITADFKYHQFFDADGKIQIADIGHYESEHFTMEILADHISGKFPKFAVHFTTVNTNPINYC